MEETPMSEIYQKEPIWCVRRDICS